MVNLILCIFRFESNQDKRLVLALKRARKNPRPYNRKEEAKVGLQEDCFMVNRKFDRLTGLF